MPITHLEADAWPVSPGTGVLLEVDHVIFDTKIQLLEGNVRNLPTATVRAVAPDLPEAFRERLMPTGQEPGSEGAKVLFSRPNIRHLYEVEYREAGLEAPTEDNGKNDLGLINADKIMAIIEDNETPLPFSPLGSRVFFEFDLDDESAEEKQLESGLIVREKDLATDNQMATVTGVGPDCRHLSVGDRVIAPRQSGAVKYNDEQYFYVSKETEIISVLRGAK